MGRVLGGRGCGGRWFGEGRSGARMALALYSLVKWWEVGGESAYRGMEGRGGIGEEYCPSGVGKVGLREVVWKKGGLRDGDLGEGDLRQDVMGQNGIGVVI